MLKYIFTFLFFYHSISLLGNPSVPSKMEFAGIQLSITEAARKEIQTDVDALHRNQAYLLRKVDKIDLYFPIIERVFNEERLPDDFKYLVVQESALISDAVSSSNAVGFWQFKKLSAEEVGLRVDKYIDERMHITASSHAAARYLKKNNFFFDNWVYALLAYNTGPGGAEQHIDKKYLGKKKMEINKRTHWYVKKFLAHKIAFENEINKNYSTSFKLYEYEKTQNKSLKEISDFLEVDHQTLAEYNKWLRKGRIPADKTYLAIIPVSSNDLVAENLLGTGGKTNPVDIPKSKMVFQNTYKPASEFDFNKNQEFPKINNSATSTKIKINGIPGFIASSADDINSIPVDHSISINKFLKYNDMTSSDRIIAGQVYYLKSKKSKAKIHYHVVIPGENAWSISQKYGIKVNKLLAKNRMREEKDLSPGMVMWLRFIRPGDVPIEYKESEVQNVIVKSIPNEIEYPQQSFPPIEESEPEILPQANRMEQGDDNFMFEEVNEDTEYINENSYVDLKEKDDSENFKEQSSESSAVEKKYVKKEELYHIVKSGETLFSISRAYGITIGELRQWNFIDDLDVLSIGQRLVIKNASVPSKNVTQYASTGPKYLTYKVKSEDTLYGIARAHNVSIKELMDINEKDDFVIKTGEVIKIPGNK